MKWISIKNKVPTQFQDVLVSDHEKQWVASCYGNIWMASHPDYRRNNENQYGCPYLVLSIPTHWMPLPEKPKE